jgi:hypothetical protein
MLQRENSIPHKIYPQKYSIPHKNYLQPQVGFFEGDYFLAELVI